MFGPFVSQVHAQTNCDPGSGGINLAKCLTLSDGQLVRDVYTDPAFLVNLIVRNVFVLAGIILFFMFMLAGYKLLQKDKAGLEDVKQIVLYSLIGFIIMFSAYWIVQVVEFVTGADIRL